MAKTETEIILGVDYRLPLSLRSVRKIMKNARSAQVKEADAKFPPTVEIFTSKRGEILYKKTSKTGDGRLLYPPIYMRREDWKALLGKMPDPVK